MSIISIIIPAHNRSNVIARALQGVLAQDYDDLDIVVVDDCSDDSEALDIVIADIADSRIRTVRHEHNLGGGGARNTGIDHARGEYIAFCDSDDEWQPGKLNRQLAALEAASDPHNAVVYSPVLQKGQDYSWVNPRRGIRPDEDVSEYLFAHGFYMQTSTLMLSRQLASDVRFKVIPRHQDYDFCLRLANAGATFLFVDEPLVIFHQDDAAGRTSSMTAYDYSRQWLAEYEPYMNERGRRGFALNVVFKRMMMARRPMTALAFAHQQGILGAAVGRFPVYAARSVAPAWLVRWQRRARSR